MKFLKTLGDRIRRPPRRDDDPSTHANTTSKTLIAILAARALLHAHIDQSAHNGLVPDALVQSLEASHAAELAELRRQLNEEQAGYNTCLRQLDAMFPEPQPPAPEPPTPRAPQFFPRLGKLIGQRPSQPRSSLLH